MIVLRAGDVIPQVVSPAPHAVENPDRAPPERPPERCPVCETPTEKPEGRVFTRCPNRACPDRRWQLLKHFVSRGAMDVDGLGEKQVAALQARGPRAHRGRLLPAHQGAAARARGRRRGLGREPPARDRGIARAAVRDACCSRSASRASATSPAATSRSSSARSTTLLAATPEQIAETPGIGPVVAALIHEQLPTSRCGADRRPARRTCASRPRARRPARAR